MLSLVSNSRSLTVGEVDFGCQIVRDIGPRPQRSCLIGARRCFAIEYWLKAS